MQKQKEILPRDAHSNQTVNRTQTTLAKYLLRCTLAIMLVLGMTPLTAGMTFAAEVEQSDIEVTGESVGTLGGEETDSGDLANPPTGTEPDASDPGELSLLPLTPLVSLEPLADYTIDLSVTPADGTGYTWNAGDPWNTNGKIVTFNTSANGNSYRIIQSGDSQNVSGVVVATGVSTTIVIQDINLQTVNSPFRLEGNAKLALQLVGSNTLKATRSNSYYGSGENNAGLSVPSNATLSISGAGSLSATSGSLAAGIGGDNNSIDAGIITINGGTVTAISDGAYGAGIGGGHNGSGGNGGTITINGGTVTATGGYGAGIGGGGFNGNGGNGGTVTINNGVVKATSQMAAGIGGGYDGSGGNITIHGGVVEATGGGSSAGIGGDSDGGIITITEGTVTATGRDTYSKYHTGIGGPGSIITINGGSVTATGIGGGTYGTGSTINISGGTIETTGGQYYAGIGGGYDGSRGSITISGGVVETTGGSSSAGIGAGYGGAGYSIVITDGTVTATGGPASAGIGGGDENGSITISGGTITANGGSGGAGIGSSNWGAGQSITISNATVTATGGNTYNSSGAAGGSGIGAGEAGHSGSITIKSGFVTATGGPAGAGIGGSRDTVGTINISGGTVVATAGGSGGAGIGGDTGTSGGIITISGGTITATGGSSGAGIGGGGGATGWSPPYDYYGSSGTIKIINGTITATGGSGGAGIGGGSGCPGDSITISGGTVTATGGGAGIGGGSTSAGASGGFSGAGGAIIISGGTVTAAGVGSGIGGSAEFINDPATSVSIDSAATVKAYANRSVAAIDSYVGNTGSGYYVNACFNKNTSFNQEMRLAIYPNGSSSPTYFLYPPFYYHSFAYTTNSTFPQNDRIDAYDVSSGTFLGRVERADNSSPDIASTKAAAPIAVKLNPDSSLNPGPAPSSQKLKPFSGTNRNHTAALIAREAYPTGAQGVIIANGEGQGKSGKFPDALAASALSGLLDYPILLTAPGSLPQETVAALKDLKPSNIVVLGAANTVSNNVYNALKSYGSVQRIWGNNRIETAVAIYKYGLQQKPGGWAKTAIFADASNFPDALSIAPLASYKKIPVFLVSGNTLPTAVRAVFTKQNFTDAIIVGDTKAVSATTATQIRSILGKDPTRLGGKDRYDTSVRIARYLVSSQGMQFDSAGIATAQNFPDALAGAALLGKRGSVMLLADYSAQAKNLSTIDLLAGSKGSVQKIHIFGATTSVSQQVRDYAVKQLGWA